MRDIIRQTLALQESRMREEVYSHIKTLTHSDSRQSQQAIQASQKASNEPSVVNHLDAANAHSHAMNFHRKLVGHERIADEHQRELRRHNDLAKKITSQMVNNSQAYRRQP